MRDQLADRPVLAKVLTNVSWLTLERVFSMATSFVVTVSVTRDLGADRTGIYAYSLNLMTMLRGVSALGLEKIVIRHLAGEDGDDAQLLATSIWLHVAGAALICALIAGFVILIELTGLTRAAVLLVALRYVFDATEIFDY